MTHDDVRAWILEAAPADLHRPPAEIRVHLEACDACAADLSTVRSGLASLAPAVDSRLDEESAVRLARAGWSSAPPSTRLWPGIAAAAALAAAVLIVAIGVPGTGRPVQDPPIEPARAETPSAPAVIVASGERVAVFATPNPKIHVVWMIEEPTTSRETP